MTPDHGADAGGDPADLQAKQALREEVWQALIDEDAARFPGARGRIPNFVGAEAAADRLRGLEVWRHAAVVKSNPDSPQWPVRQRALADGLVLYLAVPRLAQQQPFLRLDPAGLDVAPRAASSIKGAETHGQLVAVEDLEPVDLVVSGCVAVDRAGARLGKGGGFADLEFALAQAAGVITEDTTVVTTVHQAQIVDTGRIPMTDHDVPVDLVITPDEMVRCGRRHPRPDGIEWDQLTEEKIASIPLLQRWQQQSSTR